MTNGVSEGVSQDMFQGALRDRARPGVVGVIGAGAWGTALANVAAAADRDVILWTRDPLQADRLAATRTNPRFLPGIRLHDRVRFTRTDGGWSRARLYP